MAQHYMWKSMAVQTIPHCCSGQPGSCTVRVWDHYIPVLSERFQVVRIDIRGWGESSPAADPAQYTLEQYAQDACDVLDHLGIERCHVWSQSWGTRPNIVFCAV